jgi:hypothetical protein
LKGFAVLLFAVLALPGHAQENRLQTGFQGSLDWERGKLEAIVSFDLARAGIRLPPGRGQGEEILEEIYPRLLVPRILSLRADSAFTLQDLVEKGELSLDKVDELCREAGKIPPSLSPDLSRMSGRYTIDLENVSALLSRHREPAVALRLVAPLPVADYTGIIIIARGELPIHGRRTAAPVEPCVFPKIWDTQMNLVYERTMTSPASLPVRYAGEDAIFRPTLSGLERNLAALAGDRPLRILARGVFGAAPTDPIIDRADALIILSSENNRRLLREGRVIIVINQENLQKDL